ncbi:hypothetical protein MPH_01203 [Macrophomina phaseolina MS6]|uniref:MICOS complex subunit MIC12 n=2 Tax=Macrophomina phaseolina TaxID=35725 RepID=K2S9C3_MACPH|nr:hypothetical protein MPH_01203 [Macrophomina phaseolina MS6]KAH7043811.1 hypothetical protein B0J12DRAFT_671888 [Macrophomina phaseolina]
MGFTAGFLGGLTLTSSVLYLTTLFHQRNRLEQALTLRNSSHTLKQVYDPDRIYTPPSLRTRTAGIGDTAKDRWNSEVEKAVRRMQETDWREVGREVEGTLWRLVERVRKSDGDK